MRNVAIRLRCRQEITLSQIPLEKFDRHSIDSSGRSGIVPRSLITHKCVSTVKFVPAEDPIGVGQGIVNDRSSLAWHVRVLATENHQQFSLNLRNSIE